MEKITTKMIVFVFMDRFEILFKKWGEKVKEWTLIDYNFRDKLPKEDCKIWITRTMCTGERWVQMVDFYADTKNIEWDGTIAWMIADDDKNKPSPCDDKCVVSIQNVR